MSKEKSLNLKSITRHIWHAVRPYRWILAMAFVISTIGVAADKIFTPIFYKRIVDAISAGGPSDQVVSVLIRSMIMVGVFILIREITWLTVRYTDLATKSKIMRDLHNYAFQKYLSHPQRFFVNNFSGSLVAKAKRLVTSYRIVHNEFLYRLLIIGVQIVGISIVLTITHTTIGAVFIGWMVLYVVVIYFFVKYRIPMDLDKAAADSKVTARLSDVITNAANVKVFAKEAQEIERYAEVTQSEHYQRKRAWFFLTHQEVVQGTLLVAIEITLLYIMINLWQSAEITVGTFVLVHAYFVGLMTHLWKLGQSLNNIFTNISNMSEIVRVFDTPIDIHDPVEPKDSSIRNGQVVFKNLTFKYVDGQAVFKNFNLEIKPGEKVGIVGHSGAGKSTIVNLLMRFADPQAGAVLIDGQDIRDITQADLRQSISYVPQDPLLFHRSLAENIAYGKPSAGQGEIEDAAKQARAHQFITEFTDGYDTFVGERGVKLSGGQRQRVAIARAMLEGAPILILDEATSSLDSISEKYIQEAFEAASDGRTTIVIAHRLSTIQKMDRIVVLDKGEIVEEGTHDELLKHKGHYYELWSHQTDSFIR